MQDKKLHLQPGTRLSLMPIMVTKDTVTSGLQGATLDTRSQHDKVTPVGVQTCPLPCKAGSWSGGGPGMAQERMGGGSEGHNGPHTS